MTAERLLASEGYVCFTELYIRALVNSAHTSANVDNRVLSVWN